MAKFKKNISQSTILQKFISMIFATIGTDYHDFKRMHEMLILLTKELTEEKFIYQYGHAKINQVIPKNLLIRKFITKEEFEYNLLNSSNVITHAGAGTLLQCFEKNVIPFVLPRRVEFKEHLNNHQLDILDEFEKQNLCVNIEKLSYKKLKDFLKNKKLNKIKKEIKIEKLLLKKLKESIYQVC